MPRNPSGDTAFDTTFRFETASPALNRPAERPTRASRGGTGGSVCGGVFLPQAEATSNVAAIADRVSDMEVGEREGRLRVRSASAACGQFPSPGQLLLHSQT